MKAKTIALLSLVVIIPIAFLVHRQYAEAHCEIPCGIYADKTRIDLLYEDVTTIEKSMAQINSLSGKGDPLTVNQLVRWVENKDEHATKAQEIVWQYFMTQRVKPKSADDAAFSRYQAQLTALHQALVSAMKCKQTVDANNAKMLRANIDAFAAAYFSADDLKHIRAEHGGGGQEGHK